MAMMNFQDKADFDYFQKIYESAIMRRDYTVAREVQVKLYNILDKIDRQEYQEALYDHERAMLKTFQIPFGVGAGGSGGEYANEEAPVYSRGPGPSASNTVHYNGRDYEWSAATGSWVTYQQPVNYAPQHYDKLTQAWYDAQPRKEEPVKPEIRIGDKERGRYIDHLGNMFAGGYLTQDEFESRMELASTAKAESHLKTLVEDLPPMPSPFRGEPVVLNEKRSLVSRAGPYAWGSLVGMLLFLLVLAFI